MASPETVCTLAGISSGASASAFGGDGWAGLSFVEGGGMVGFNSPVAGRAPARSDKTASAGCRCAETSVSRACVASSETASSRASSSAIAGRCAPCTELPCSAVLRGTSAVARRSGTPCPAIRAPAVPALVASGASGVRGVARVRGTSIVASRMRLWSGDCCGMGRGASKGSSAAPATRCSASEPASARAVRPTFIAREG